MSICLYLSFFTLVFVGGFLFPWSNRLRENDRLVNLLYCLLLWLRLLILLSVLLGHHRLLMLGWPLLLTGVIDENYMLTKTLNIWVPALFVGLVLVGGIGQDQLRVHLSLLRELLLEVIHCVLGFEAVFETQFDSFWLLLALS